MYHVSAQGVDERLINVHYYYYSGLCYCVCVTSFERCLTPFFCWFRHQHSESDQVIPKEDTSWRENVDKVPIFPVCTFNIYRKRKLFSLRLWAPQRSNMLISFLQVEHDLTVNCCESVFALFVSIGSVWFLHLISTSNKRDQRNSFSPKLCTVLDAFAILCKPADSPVTTSCLFIFIRWPYQLGLLHSACTYTMTVLFAFVPVPDLHLWPFTCESYNENVRCTLGSERIHDLSLLTSGNVGTLCFRYYCQSFPTDFAALLLLALSLFV